MVIFSVHRLALFSAIASLVWGAVRALEQGETTILSYAVDMTISSRFARTHIQMEIANDRDDCTALTGFTFQLPINARVTAMTMRTTPGNCEKTGVVKEIQQAEQEFVQQAVQGQTAALLKAYDVTQYGLQIAIPKSGVTTIDIHLEELLQRYRGQVQFQLPLYLGLEVDLLTMDIAIQEPRSGVARFGIVLDYDGVDSTLLSTMQIAPSDANRPVATAHLEAQSGDLEPGVLSPLPRLLTGYYDPGPLPLEGLLLSDPFGTCYVHLFNPDSLLASTGSLPRNIVFAIDVSGSMSGQKMDDAKAAFSAIIDRLTGDDYFVVQTFSTDAVEARFGPYLATEDVKILARDWVHNLRTMGSTNLEGAYIEGIQQVLSMQSESQQVLGAATTTFVPVVMILTDGQPTVGERNPARIASNVRYTCGEKSCGVKIYGLAFGDEADYALLAAISLQNGGRAVRIYEGYGDSVKQMENFFDGELGTIFMTDVQVSFNGNLDSQTQSMFPVFAAGAEVAARGRVLGAEATAVTVATTTAFTGQGYMEWNADISTSEQLQLLPNNGNECIQSFAHQKIKELMEFRDACLTLGSEEMMDFYPLYSLYNGMAATEVGRNSGGQKIRRIQEQDMCKAVEEEALQLAIEAAVVWPGLTAMVTVDNAACEQATQGVPICFEGDGDGDEKEEGIEDERPGDSNMTMSASPPDPADTTGGTPAAGSSGGGDDWQGMADGAASPQVTPIGDEAGGGDGFTELGSPGTGSSADEPSTAAENPGVALAVLATGWLLLMLIT